MIIDSQLDVIATNHIRNVLDIMSVQKNLIMDNIDQLIDNNTITSLPSIDIQTRLDHLELTVTNANNTIDNQYNQKIDQISEKINFLDTAVTNANCAIDKLNRQNNIDKIFAQPTESIDVIKNSIVVQILDNPTDPVKVFKILKENNLKPKMLFQFALGWKIHPSGHREICHRSNIIEYNGNSLFDEYNHLVPETTIPTSENITYNRYDYTDDILSFGKVNAHARENQISLLYMRHSCSTSVYLIRNVAGVISYELLRLELPYQNNNGIIKFMGECYEGKLFDTLPHGDDLLIRLNQQHNHNEYLRNNGFKLIMKKFIPPNNGSDNYMSKVTRGNDSHCVNVVDAYTLIIEMWRNDLKFISLRRYKYHVPPMNWKIIQIDTRIY